MRITQICQFQGCFDFVNKKVNSSKTFCQNIISKIGAQFQQLAFNAKRLLPSRFNKIEPPRYPLDGRNPLIDESVSDLNIGIMTLFLKKYELKGPVLPSVIDEDDYRALNDIQKLNTWLKKNNFLDNKADFEKTHEILWASKLNYEKSFTSLVNGYYDKLKELNNFDLSNELGNRIIFPSVIYRKVNAILELYDKDTLNTIKEEDKLTPYEYISLSVIKSFTPEEEAILTRFSSIFLDLPQENNIRVRFEDRQRAIMSDPNSKSIWNRLKIIFIRLFQRYKTTNFKITTLNKADPTKIERKIYYYGMDSITEGTVRRLKIKDYAIDCSKLITEFPNDDTLKTKYKELFEKNLVNNLNAKKIKYPCVDYVKLRNKIIDHFKKNFPEKAAILEKDGFKDELTDLKEQIIQTEPKMKTWINDNDMDTCQNCFKMGFLTIFNVLRARIFNGPDKKVSEMGDVRANCAEFVGYHILKAANDAHKELIEANPDLKIPEPCTVEALGFKKGFIHSGITPFSLHKALRGKINKGREILIKPHPIPLSKIVQLKWKNKPANT